MRILVIEPHPEHGGGMEAFSLRLSKALAQRGHQIVLAYEREGSMLADYVDLSETVVPLSLPGFPLRRPAEILRELRALSRLVRQHDIDVVFSSHLGFLRVGALLNLLQGVPAYFHLGLPAASMPSTVRWLLPWVGGGMCPAAHVMQTWLNIGWPKERIWEIPNWVDCEAFAPRADMVELRSQYGLPAEGFLLGYIGRIVSDKGVEVLLAAFDQLSDRFPDLYLVLVGGGEEDYISRLPSLVNARSHLIVLPKVTDTSELYNAMNLICVPSIASETFGLVLLEAMACGKPVVTSDMGVMPDILGDDAAQLVAKAGDELALAGRIESFLVRRHSANEIGARLRERAVTRFGPEKAVPLYEMALRGDHERLHESG